MKGLVYGIILGAYVCLFIVVGILDAKKKLGFKDFIAAGKNKGLVLTVGTLLATILGASSTIGIADTTYQIGFPGFWWLCLGAIGLILQSLLISEKIRKIDADTLPDLAGRIVGGSAEMLISLIIVISWIGVIAGQLVAMSSFLTFITGINTRWIFIIVSVVAFLYTIFGGQTSVVKTDFIQLIFIMLGLVITFIYLFFVRGDASGEVFRSVEFLNENYRPVNLFTQFFVIGGVYFLGPDIVSRNFISKDEKTARRSALTAGIILIGFAFLMAFIGLWAKKNIPPSELGGMKTLFFIINMLPLPVGIMLSIGLLSAILSSFDTCIINAASIFVRDILRKESVMLVRITVAVIGVLAMMFALSGSGDIITLLSGAYSIYTAGAIFPILIAILFHEKRIIRKNVWVAAVICGGVLGIIGSYFPGFISGLPIPAFVKTNLSLIGMGISCLVGLFSVGGKRS